MKILELEWVKELLSMAFQQRISHLEQLREIAGGKAGMDDNSESGMLIFIPSNKGVVILSSAYLLYQF